MRDPYIKKITEKVLRKEALNGQTTLADASALCMQAVDLKKVSRALLLTSLHDLFKREVTHQLKRSMIAGSSGGFKVLPKVPPEIVSRLPQWFATGEGPGAIWVPSPLAKIEQIKASRDLRVKKADQTIAQADFLGQLIEYLIANGCDSLSDI